MHDANSGQLKSTRNRKLLRENELLKIFSSSVKFDGIGQNPPFFSYRHAPLQTSILIEAESVSLKQLSEYLSKITITF